MEYSTREVEEYEKILKEFKNCLINLTNILTTESTTPAQPNDSLLKALIAAHIAEILANNFSIFQFLDRLSAENLADTLTTYHNKYEVILIQANVEEKIIINFKTNITTLANNLTHERKAKLLKISDFSIVKELIQNLAHHCQKLFVEPIYNHLEVEAIQSMALALHIKGLSLNQQRGLLDKLLLVKELWWYETLQEIEKSLTKPFNLIETLGIFEFASTDQVISKIIEIIVDEHKVLCYLENNKLSYIYDRLKNIDPQPLSIVELLEKVHIEAQYRYNNNRISDSEIELLKRFQAYDIILTQIENSEFALIETFLIRNSMFMHEVLILIAKHADNISAIGIVQSPALAAILQIISESLPSHPEDINSASGAIMLSLVKSKFATTLNSHQAKRYAQLDKFTVNSLKQKYNILLKHMANLVSGAAEAKTFIEQTIVNKLAKNYYTASAANSTTKIKSMIRDRAELAKQLAEIDFVEIFNSKYSNKITSLNFKSKFSADYSMTTQQYVQSIVNSLVSLCTPSQLRALQTNIIGNDLTDTQLIVKEEIIKQVHYRTTKIKRLGYLLTGKIAELRELLEIKNSLLDLNSLHLQDI